MARPAICLLVILLLPLAAATGDPQGDPSARIGGAPVDVPAIDLKDVNGTIEGGVLSLTLTTWGDLLVGSQAPAQNASRLYTYLFIVALGAAPDTNLYTHVSSGGESITAVCTYSEGALDLACEMTHGNGTLRGAGADGAELTARFAIAFKGPIAIGGSAHLSIPNGTEREILAQDFTSNALPYQGLPGDLGGEGGSEAPAGTPWWRSGWFIFLAIGAAIFVLGMVVPWDRLKPGKPRRK